MVKRKLSHNSESIDRTGLLGHLGGVEERCFEIGFSECHRVIFLGEKTSLKSSKSVSHNETSLTLSDQLGESSITTSPQGSAFLFCSELRCMDELRCLGWGQMVVLHMFEMFLCLVMVDISLSFFV